MAKVSPIEFFHQVRQEISKVTWPSRKETAVTTGMVFVMVIFCSLFFLVVDYFLAQGVDWLLRIGG